MNASLLKAQVFLSSAFSMYTFGGLVVGLSQEVFCSATAADLVSSDSDGEHMYWKVTNPTLSPHHLQDLPGFTRSVYKRDHALITPESHVFSPLPDWANTIGAYLVTPAMGSHFVMYLAKMQGTQSKLAGDAIWKVTIMSICMTLHTAQVCCTWKYSITLSVIQGREPESFVITSAEIDASQMCFLTSCLRYLIGNGEDW